MEIKENKGDAQVNGKKAREKNKWKELYIYIYGSK